MDKELLLTNQDMDINKQCLICLQGPITNYNNIIIDDVKLINEMHFLIMNCKCQCLSHHKCLEKWITNNSSCPICREHISFPKPIIIEETILIPTNEHIHLNEIIVLQTNKNKVPIYFRILLIIFFGCVIFTIITND